MTTIAATDRPDTHEMVVVHRIFRRESGLLPAMVRAVAPGDTARAALVAESVRDYLDGLHNHHTGEDELIWPLLLARVDLEQELVLRMEAQHEMVAAALARVGELLPAWQASADPASGWLVVAYDVLGGQFVWIPATSGARPTIHYFGPDVLEWQDLEQVYADWLYAMLVGSLTRFYDTLRWPGWETEVATVPLSHGLTTFPPPWTVEGKDLATVSRQAVPMMELAEFHLDTARQLGRAGD